MLDTVFIWLNQWAHLAGVDWSWILIMIGAILLGPTIWAGLAVPRLLQTLIIAAGLVVVSFFVFATNPESIEAFYIKTGLITEAFLDVHFIFRYVTEFGFSIFVISVSWLVFSIIFDCLRGEPLTIKARLRKQTQFALEMDKLEIERMISERKKRTAKPL